MIFRTNKYGKKYPIFVDEETTNDYMNNTIKGNTTKSQNYELYHGSNKDFDEFDDKYIGTNSLGGLAFGKGHYFLENDKDYGGTSVFGKYSYKVNIKLRNPFIVQEQNWNNELANMGYDWNNKLTLDPSDFLASKGYDATFIQNGTKSTDIIVYTNKDKKIKIIDKKKNY